VKGLPGGLVAAAVVTLLAACGSGQTPIPEAGVVAPLALQTPDWTPPPTPTPAPTPSAAPQQYGTGTVSRGVYRPSPPRYPVVDRFDAPSVGVHINVAAVGIVRGAMEAPEGPLGSVFWKEGFWLDLGAVPGNPGTATIAGHLDDTAGRPAAFWNIRYLHVGDELSVTRLSDGAVLHYHIVETDTWTLSQANTTANLRRIYGDGTSGDGVARLSLITCTGRFVNGEYDHRFVAFAVLDN